MLIIRLFFQPTMTVLDIPKVKQKPNHCGPACLSMVAQYFGKSLDQEEIAQYWGGEEHFKKGGVARQTLVQCARHHGFIANSYEGLSLDNVVEFIDRGLPIIARVQASRRWSHYIVIKGYQTNPTSLFLNDPGSSPYEEQPYEDFVLRWRIRRKNHASYRYGIVLRPRE